VIAIAPPGLDHFRGLTQGSQSLALGLTLTAAPQLVAGSRLMRHDHRLLSYAPVCSKYIIPKFACVREKSGPLAFELPF